MIIRYLDPWGYKAFTTLQEPFSPNYQVLWALEVMEKSPLRVRDPKP